MLAHVVEFHAEAQVGLVRAIPAYRFTIFHPPERTLRGDPCGGAGALHHAFDHAEDGVLSREGNFEIELGELRLPVGAQVFVAETFYDLEITVEAADHQDLLKNLWRLRQRVELA